MKLGRKEGANEEKKGGRKKGGKERRRREIGIKGWMKTHKEESKERMEGGMDEGRERERGRRDGETGVDNALYFFAILGPPKEKGIFSVHNL